MNYFSGLLLFLVFCSCDGKRVLGFSYSLDVSNSIVKPKHIIVGKTSEKITIDGLSNEASWNSCSYSDSFIDIQGIDTPRYDTKMKMLWDEEYLYVFAQLIEPHIWGDLKKRDTVIFYNNDFEVFIDPSGDTYNYGEIEINALGTVWDLKLDKPYRVGGNAENDWDLEKLKTGIQIYGTLNRPRDIDSMWTVEMAIPMKDLIELKSGPKGLPKEGEQWRINFSRVEWDHEIVDGRYQRKKVADESLEEYNWVWSDQKVINMHEPEKWGYLQFSEKSVVQNVSFIEDPDEETKQIAFALFRETHNGSLKYLQDKRRGSNQKIMVKVSEEKTLKALFSKTVDGYHFRVENNQTKNVFNINEKGFLIQLK